MKPFEKKTGKKKVVTHTYDVIYSYIGVVASTYVYAKKRLHEIKQLGWDLMNKQW